MEHMLWARHNATGDAKKKKKSKTHFLPSKAQKPKSGARLSM